ncbi:MAG: PAS domain S-box protein [Desulfatibacillum sp.]|nr:PAS domain S-box protein [Desulfatibacillum sp.]
MSAKPTYEELEKQVQALKWTREALKTTETALRDSEIKYQKTFESITDSITITRVEDGLYLYVNDGFCQQTGYSREEVLGRTPTDIKLYAYPGERDRFIGLLKKFGKTENVIVSFRRKNGEIYLSEFSAKPLSYEGEQCLLAQSRDITERKRVEDALRISEEKHKEMIANISDVIAILAPDGTVTYTSPNIKKWFGWDWEEMIGIDGLTIVHPDDLERIQIDFRELLQQEKTQTTVEYRYRCKDGSYKWIELTGLNILNNPSINGVLVSYHDITEKKINRDRLKLSESRYLKAQKLGKVGNWEYNLQTKEFWGSDEAKRIYGFDLEMDSFTTDEVENCIPERARVHQALIDLIEHGKEYNLEFDIITKNTHKRKTIISIAELERDSEGNPLNVSGVIHDITKRKRSENALKKSEEQLRTIFQAAKNVSFIITNAIVDPKDPDLKILEFSPGAEEIFGYSREEVLGRPVSILHLPEDVKKFAQAHQQMKEGKSGFSGEITLVRKSGEKFPALFSTYPLLDENGKMYAALGVSLDLKEQQKLEAQLRQAQKMESVGRLAGGVAHDFNNMLSIILGNAEMVMEDMAPDNPFRANLIEIFNAAERSTNLTRQLLAFARKQTIAPKVLDLNKTLDNVLNMLKRLMGEDIELVWLPQKDLWRVKIDPSQVDQIMANLCINARDAINGVGKVTIETSNVVLNEEYCRDHAGYVPGNFVMIAVNDNGSGMDKETQEHLFEPFFTTKEMDKGTGLGLATVYGIIKQNNGFINVYSELGRGTTFTIYLPWHESSLVKKGASAPAMPDARGNETILLVEDEKRILKMAATMLERLGYTVLMAGSPGQAIDIASKHAAEIDLLMTDVIMPDMNGRDLSRQIQALCPGLKVLFMSGYTANVIAHHGVLDQGVEFIHKPFSKQELAVKIREVLDLFCPVSPG